MPNSYHSDRCVNPFKKEGETGHKGKSLRRIPSDVSKKFPDLPKNSKICTHCRKRAKIDIEPKNMDTEVNHKMSTSMEFENNINDSGLEAENSMEDIGQQPSARELDLEEMLSGLKEKFKSLPKHDPLKVRILTILPSSWSYRKIENEFGASRNLVRKSRILKERGGILADTTVKTGKVLPDETIEKVIEFYNSDLNSRMMPGVKDCVSLIIDGKRERVQKRLILMNLKDLYTSFKDNYSEIKISFSAFAKLRPKNCILSGASGTHSVCVCTIHQNVKLMLDAISVEKLTESSEIVITSYKDCLTKMMCNNPTNDCHLDNCKNCPGTAKIVEHLSKLLDESSTSDVEFSMWTGTDRSTLITQTLPVEEFMDELCEKLSKLKPHSFIAKQQNLFVAKKKEELRENEALVMFDFSENYAYVCQDASQAFHYNNDQCTVFTCICYYKEKGEIKHKSHVFLSKSTKHDTAAVYTNQTMLIPLIKKDVKKLKKIIYVTDGAKQHFKNRYQISNLVHHVEDFQVEAEWHFNATSHGKSSFDGIGAKFKREAYRASLMAKPNESILKSSALLKWGKGHFKNIHVSYYSKADHNKMTRKLNQRFNNNSPPVPQILKNHGFIVRRENNQKTVLIKRYSNAKDGNEWEV